MIDELREEEIVNKVGGRFKLATLIQKRLIALNAGARPLVSLKTDNKMEIAIREIVEDKIFLDTTCVQPSASDLGGPGEFTGDEMDEDM
jgi:DNA-directed RNA polymerase subunit omega